MLKEIYFENVLKFGDLYLDKVLNEFEEENIIFTCTDNSGDIFLSVCYEFRFKLKFILCKITINNLIELFTKQIDLYTIFKDSDCLINIITDNDGDHITKVDYEHFNKDLLPTPGVYLKPDFGNIELTYYMRI